MNVVPWPCSLDAVISPPCSSHELLHQREADAGALVVRPRAPLDPVEALEQARQLGLRDADAGVAHRELDGRRPRGASATAISPSKVNLKALERRLRTIFSHMSRST